MISARFQIVITRKLIYLKIIQSYVTLINICISMTIQVIRSRIANKFKNDTVPF